MATLVLGAVGALIGARFGGVIGTLIGQQIDQRLFAPKGREGPRLADLRVQGSSYGALLPRLYGTLRVAGSVIWSTDLIESRSRRGGGKGRPSTTVYSYSASFAVLLSARPILGVRRIWADGNLLRGAAGDWKTETGFRLHLGGEDQPPDPLIASAEGIAPAYRGAAYAVFENLPLETFGNRIPLLTFEVEADTGPVPAGAVLADASGGRIAAAGGEPLAGFAAATESIGALAELLAAALPIDLIEAGAGLALADPDAPIVTIDAAEIAEDRDETRDAQPPGEARLAYFDPARDYQAGLQRARRSDGSPSLVRADLPAALDAGQAKRLATSLLEGAGVAAVRRSLRCGWRRLSLAPGARVRIGGEADIWRLARRTVLRDGVRLDLVLDRRARIAPLPASPGRIVPAPDLLHGPTVAHLLDLPPLDDAAPDVPRLWVAAAGPSPGWRRAGLLVSLDAGASWEAIGRTLAPAVIGSAASALPFAPEAVIDRRHAVEVLLLHEEMMLGDADFGRLIAGDNLALLGDELIQFGRAEPLGGGRWRLSGLVRGRRGTGWAAGLHMAGERFVLIEPDALLAWDPPIGAAGGSVRLLASGPGDAAPAQAEAVAIGAALQPPAPVHLRSRRRGDGGFDLVWVRSSRRGWRWTDGADVPLAEEREAYAIEIAGPGISRQAETSAPAFTYPAAAVAADRALAPGVTIAVRQIGTHAASRPASLTLVFMEA